MQRLRRLEDQGRELMQIVSPVGPCMEAAALMLLHLDAGAFKDGNRSMTVLERDVILARIYPEETKRLARSAYCATSVSCSSLIELGNHPELNTPT